MAVKKIITIPNPLLRQKSISVKFSTKGESSSVKEKKLKKLVDDLIETAKVQQEPEGVGLSAIQIGIKKRVIVAIVDNDFTPFVNPEITRSSKRKFSQVFKENNQFLEGCLSIPGIFAFVDRPYWVVLKWQDLTGKKHQKKFIGKQSAYIQHELDHCDGILFTDRALKQNQKIYQVEKNQNGKEELVEVKIF